MRLPIPHPNRMHRGTGFPDVAALQACAMDVLRH
jgi:hypothetical protein